MAEDENENEEQEEEDILPKDDEDEKRFEVKGGGRAKTLFIIHEKS